MAALSFTKPEYMHTANPVATAVAFLRHDCNMCTVQ